MARGDERAFRELYDHYRQKIYSLGMYLTRSEPVSEEIVQEVFMKTWEKREQLTGIDYFNAWLRTVARNICINHLRSLALERLALHSISVSRKENENSTENLIIEREYKKIIDAAIRQLPGQRKKVYVMHREQGLKHEQIAQQLGLSVFTVKEHMKLALRSIRQYLESHIDTIVVIAIALYLE